MITLAQQLIECGLIQFGWFERDGATLPVDVHLEMIASFPDILAHLVAESRAVVDTAQFDRLLCKADSIPLGVAISLASGVPLVYSRGTSEALTSDLVGAYDGGHSTLLLANTVDAVRDLQPLVSSARRVGLQVNTLLTILEMRPMQPIEGLAQVSLLRLEVVVRDLSADHRLPAGHAQVILDWVAAPYS